MNNKIKTPSDEDKSIEEIKSFYDSVYYAEKSNDLTLSRHYFRMLKKLRLTSGQSILDVACGSGEWLKVCERSGLKVAGIDLSEKAIKICKANMLEGEFYSQPAENLPFQENRFDIVTCLGSLEHFINPVESLREMLRVAKKDAVFIILVPNTDFLTRKLGLFGGTQQVEAKEDVRTLEEWNSLFEDAGLSVKSKWKDLHVISWHWIAKGKPLLWPFRALQCLLLLIWPLKWQYQVYHLCVRK